MGLLYNTLRSILALYCLTTHAATSWRPSANFNASVLALLSSLRALRNFVVAKRNRQLFPVQVDHHLLVSALPCLGTAGQQTPDCVLCHQCDDLVYFALSDRRHILPSPPVVEHARCQQLALHPLCMLLLNSHHYHTVSLAFVHRAIRYFTLLPGVETDQAECSIRTDVGGVFEGFC